MMYVVAQWRFAQWLALWCFTGQPALSIVVIRCVHRQDILLRAYLDWNLLVK